MADTFLLQLVSPERVLVEEQATEAQIPALDGYIGMMPGHAPLLTELKPGGVFTYHSGGQEKILAVYGGFVEILPDRVRVLADSAEPREEIDLNAANQQLQQALKENENFHGEADPAVALDQMMRAQAKVDAATKK